MYGTYCPGYTHAFNDGLAFRVGSNSGSYKQYPAANNGGQYNTHHEYCTGTGAPNGQFGDATVAALNVPVGTATAAPDPGTLYRVQEGNWQTIEFHYKLSSPGVTNGIIKAWVDGVKVYGNSDLETCGSYGATQGDCYAVHQIQFLHSWFNCATSNDCTTAAASGSFSLADNLVVSRAYIGPPQ